MLCNIELASYLSVCLTYGNLIIDMMMLPMIDSLIDEKLIKIIIEI